MNSQEILDSSGSELKPCPFCGGEAEMMGDQYPYVECQECAAGFTADHSYEFDEGDAASKWNQRAMPAITPEMIEAGAKRLVRWEDDSAWPESWRDIDIAAAKQDAERVIRSALSAAGNDRYGAVTVQMLPPAKRKADFIGQPMGVIVRNEAGALLAVTDLGRVTKLDDAVMGPVDRVQGAEPVAVVDRAGVIQPMSGAVSLCEGDKLYTQSQSAQQGVAEGLPKAIDMLEDYASALGNGDLDGAGHSTAQAIHEVIDMLATTPQPADNWIKCSGRLPTEADADFRDDVWVNDKALGQQLARWNTVEHISDYTHWKPTGLKRPQPPQQGGE